MLSAGQDLEVHRALVEQRGYSREKAEIIMLLLHGYGDTDLRQAATYRKLIDWLNHDNLAIRGLAFWHLTLLAPEAAGQAPYD